MNTAGQVGVLDLISGVRTKLAEMERKLQAAEREIAKLNDELASRCAPPVSPTFNVGSIRRRTAFHLHPDRGGDAELLAKLNALFDVVEKLQDVDMEGVRHAA